MGFIPLNGEIIVYTDYKTITKNGQTVTVPGVKIGSGNSYVQDLAFITDAEADSLLSHINNTTVHITTAERLYWNNKINIDDSEEVVEETLVMNRN